MPRDATANVFAGADIYASKRDRASMMFSDHGDGGGASGIATVPAVALKNATVDRFAIPV